MVMSVGGRRSVVIEIGQHMRGRGLGSEGEDEIQGRDEVELKRRMEALSVQRDRLEGG